MGITQIVGFKDLVFSKGVASLGKERFTGIVRDVLKNGDHVEQTFKDGVIQLSKRVGTKNFAKKWAKRKIFTYNGDNLYTNSDFIIRGKIGNCERIAERSGNLQTVRTPEGEYLKIFNQSGNRTIVMRDAHNVGHRYEYADARIFENGKLLSSTRADRTGHGHINATTLKEWQPLSESGFWTTANKSELESLKLW